MRLLSCCLSPRGHKMAAPPPASHLCPKQEEGAGEKTKESEKAREPGDCVLSLWYSFLGRPTRTSLYITWTQLCGWPSPAAGGPRSIGIERAPCRLPRHDFRRPSGSWQVTLASAPGSGHVLSLPLIFKEQKPPLSFNSLL